VVDLRDPHPALARLARALVFAFASVGLGAAGHVALSDGSLLSSMPSLGIVAFALLLVGLLASTVPHARWLLALAVVAGQAATHVALAVTGAQHGGAHATGAHAHHMHHDAAMSHMEHASLLSVHSLAMVLVHGVALAVGIVIVLTLEARMWRASRMLATSTIRVVGLLCAPVTQPRRASGVAPAVRVASSLSSTCSWQSPVTAGWSLRGPPIALITAS
jgi:hypothetical protein